MTCIHFGTGYKYQLRRPHVERTVIQPAENITTDWIWMDTEGRLVIRAGYAWDGASGPTFDSKSSMRASLVHDALYQLMRMGLLDRKNRELADAEFRRICKEDGMWSIRASLWHFAVRTFADPASDPALAEPDQCAPGGECCGQADS